MATRRPDLQLARGLTLVAATVAMFTGLRTLQLADAHALPYVSRVIVAVLSWFAFGERLTRWQRAAIALAFAPWPRIARDHRCWRRSPMRT